MILHPITQPMPTPEQMGDKQFIVVYRITDMLFSDTLRYIDGIPQIRQPGEGRTSQWMDFNGLPECAEEVAYYAKGE